MHIQLQEAKVRRRGDVLDCVVMRFNNGESKRVDNPKHKEGNDQPETVPNPDHAALDDKVWSFNVRDYVEVRGAEPTSAETANAETAFLAMVTVERDAWTAHYERIAEHAEALVQVDL